MYKDVPVVLFTLTQNDWKSDYQEMAQPTENRLRGVCLQIMLSGVFS